MSKLWEEMTANEKAEEIDELRVQQNTLLREFEELKRHVEQISKAVKRIERNWPHKLGGQA